MKKLRLQLADACEPVDVSLERGNEADADSYIFRAGDDVTAVEIERTGPGAGWLHLRGRVHKFYTSVHDGVVEVWVDGRRHTVDVIDRTQRRRGAADAALVDQVAAPMPGTVLKINVAPGDKFEAHQALVILESMKMEMTLSVPHSGTVKEVRCNVGELVPMGEVLVMLDAVEAESAS